MKKCITAVILLSALCAGYSVRADETNQYSGVQFATNLALAVQSGNRQAVLNLDQTPWLALTATEKIYVAALGMTPDNQKQAFIDTITNDAAKMACQAETMPQGTALNALLSDFYSTSRDTCPGWDKFDPSVCTTKEALIFYEKFLKNVVPSKATEKPLMKVKFKQTVIGSF